MLEISPLLVWPSRGARCSPLCPFGWQACICTWGRCHSIWQSGAGCNLQHLFGGHARVHDWGHYHSIWRFGVCHRHRPFARWPGSRLQRPVQWCWQVAGVRPPSCGQPARHPRHRGWGVCVGQTRGCHRGAGQSQVGVERGGQSFGWLWCSPWVRDLLLGNPLAHDD
jgi:hypothetical protein